MRKTFIEKKNSYSKKKNRKKLFRVGTTIDTLKYGERNVLKLRRLLYTYI